MKKSIKPFILAVISVSCTLSCQNKNNSQNINLDRNGQLINQGQNQTSNNPHSRPNEDLPMDIIAPGAMHFVDDEQRTVSRGFVFQDNNIDLSIFLEHDCIISKRKKTKVPATSHYRLEISSEPIKNAFKGQPLARVNVLLAGAIIKAQTKLVDMQINKEFSDLTAAKFVEKCGDGFISATFNGYTISVQRSFLVPKDFNIENVNILTMDEDLNTIEKIDKKYNEVLVQAKKSSEYLRGLGLSSQESMRGEVNTALGYDAKATESLTEVYKIKYIMDYAKTAKDKKELSELPFVQILNYSDLKNNIIIN